MKDYLFDIILDIRHSIRTRNIVLTGFQIILTFQHLPLGVTNLFETGIFRSLTE